MRATSRAHSTSGTSWRPCRTCRSSRTTVPTCAAHRTSGWRRRSRSGSSCASSPAACQAGDSCCNARRQGVSALQARTDLGLALALLSAATFGTSGALATSLIDSGWTPGAAVTVRVAIAAAVLAVPALLQLRGTRPPVGRSIRPVASYGLVAVAVPQLCYFNAVQHLSVAVALLLEYSGVLLVVGWMWMRHGHRPRRLTVG